MFFEVGSYKAHIYSWSVPYRNHWSAQPQFGGAGSRSSPDAKHLKQGSPKKNLHQFKCSNLHCFTLPSDCPLFLHYIFSTKEPLYPTSSELLPATPVELELKRWPAACSTNTGVSFSGFRVRLSLQLAASSVLVRDSQLWAEAPASATWRPKASYAVAGVAGRPSSSSTAATLLPSVSGSAPKAHLHLATWPAYQSFCGAVVSADWLVPLSVKRLRSLPKITIGRF